MHTNFRTAVLFSINQFWKLSRPWCFWWDKGAYFKVLDYNNYRLFGLLFLYIVLILFASCIMVVTELWIVLRIKGEFLVGWSWSHYTDLRCGISNAYCWSVSCIHYSMESYVSMKCTLLLLLFTAWLFILVLAKS